MPPNNTKYALFRQWIDRLNGNSVYTINTTKEGKGIYCEACQQQVYIKFTTTNRQREFVQQKVIQQNCSTILFGHLKQHNETLKHRRALLRVSEKEKRQKQQFLDATTSNIPDQFTFDLASSLISANIPFFKIENGVFRGFLERETGKNIPSRRTLGNYLEHCFKQKMDEIIEEFAGKYYWVSVDETCDRAGRCMANLLVGILDGKQWNEPKLIAVKELDKVDSDHVARFVDEGLAKYSLEKSKCLLFCTDAAAYMKKACRDLKVFYPNAFHITCLAHSLHRVAEKIRQIFPMVDKMIAKTKAVFVKAPSRVKTFREMNPTIPLPPKPILTRWGTWLIAAEYYWNNFRSVQNLTILRFLATIFASPNDEDEEEEVEAKFQISIRKSDGVESELSSFDEEWLKFSNSGFKSWGVSDLIKRKDLLNVNKGYLDCDRLTIICTLMVQQKSVEKAPLPDVEIPECRALEDVSHLFEYSLFPDCKIISKKDDKEFKVHKCILGCRSPVFAAMFQHEMVEKNNNEVNIEDMKGNVIEQMLRFIYRGKEPNMDEGMAEELLKAADKYELIRLKLFCERKLINSLGSANACAFLSLANLYPAENLKTQAINFIKMHMKEVMKSAGWKIYADDQMKDQILEATEK